MSDDAPEESRLRDVVLGAAWAGAAAGLLAAPLVLLAAVFGPKNAGLGVRGFVIVVLEVFVVLPVALVAAPVLAAEKARPAPSRRAEAWLQLRVAAATLVVGAFALVQVVYATCALRGQLRGYDLGAVHKVFAGALLAIAHEETPRTGAFGALLAGALTTAIATALKRVKAGAPAAFGASGVVAVVIVAAQPFSEPDAEFPIAFGAFTGALVTLSIALGELLAKLAARALPSDQSAG